MTTPTFHNLAASVCERLLVRCLILDSGSGRTLVLQRSANEHFAAGAWELLQGSRDRGETPDEAVRREIGEEIGWHDCPPYAQLQVVSTDHFGIDQHELLHEDWSNVNYLLVGPGLEHRQLTLGADQSDARWMDLDGAVKLLSDPQHAAYAAGGLRMLRSLNQLSYDLRETVSLLDRALEAHDQPGLGR